MTRKGWLLFIVMSVLWGIPYLFIRIAVRELDPSVVVFVRLALAAAILLPVAVQRKALGQVRHRWPLLAGLSLIQLVVPFLLISYGELHITSSLTSLLIASEPLLVALFALRLDPGERVNGFRLVGLLIGMAGVLTLLGFDSGGDSQRLLGAVFVLLATMCYAFSALLIKRPPIVSLSSLSIATVQCVTATVVLLPLAVMHLPSHLPSLEVMVSLVVLGTICTALAYLTFFALLVEVGASRGTVFTYVNPAVSVILGVLLLNEPFGFATVAGFLLIILGSWLSTGGALPSVKQLKARLQQRFGRGAEMT
ncbi:MAG TPA: DMT family transporter, partial [Ktedonobacteraceae bacterium]|nr:DMT family transporter [Ktedonobacteraceae bacterium]